MTTPAIALTYFRARFSKQGTADRARSEKAYLKSDLRFYGATQPNVRRAVVDFTHAHPDLDRRELRAIATAAFATREHEIRSAAVGVLERKRALLEERDLSWLLCLVDASNTWAHVDWLAVEVIGDVVGRYPAARRWLPKWAKQKNFWIRRTALLAQHDQLKRGEGDFALFARLAASMLHEREFFIRKAVGWVLREVSKKRTTLVYDFLRKHRDEVRGLTLREGAKYLSDAQRHGLGLATQGDSGSKPFR